jgi:hypothetical protein
MGVEGACTGERGSRERKKRGGVRQARRAPPSPLKPTPSSLPLSLSQHTTAEGISAQPSEENLRYFSVAIRGPEQSAYEGE